MRTVLFATILALVPAATACSGRVVTPTADGGASEAAVDATEEEEPPPPLDATSEGSIVPPSCPDYRPVKGVPCRTGLSCFYACAAGYEYAARATCPTGKWIIENTAACELTAPDASAD